MLYFLAQSHNLQIYEKNRDLVCFSETFLLICSNHGVVFLNKKTQQEHYEKKADCRNNPLCLHYFEIANFYTVPLRKTYPQRRDKQLSCLNTAYSNSIGEAGKTAQCRRKQACRLCSKFSNCVLRRELIICLISFSCSGFITNILLSLSFHAFCSSASMSLLVSMSVVFLWLKYSDTVVYQLQFLFDSLHLGSNIGFGNANYHAYLSI